MSSQMPLSQPRAAARRSGKGKRSRSAFEFKGRKNFAKAVKSVVMNKVLEKKFSYQIYTNQEMDWDGHRHYLTQVANGSGDNERVGRHITPSYLSGRILIQAQGVTSAVIYRNAWSLLLIQDKQQVGDNYATATEILTDIGTKAAPMGLIKDSNRGRFKILRRWEGTADLYNSQTYLNIYHKFNGFVTKYNGTAAGDIESNGLMLLFVSSADPADNSCFFTGHVRMWYTDA